MITISLPSSLYTLTIMFSGKTYRCLGPCLSCRGPCLSYRDPYPPYIYKARRLYYQLMATELNEYLPGNPPDHFCFRVPVPENEHGVTHISFSFPLIDDLETALIGEEGLVYIDWLGYEDILRHGKAVEDAVNEWKRVVRLLSQGPRHEPEDEGISN